MVAGLLEKAPVSNSASSEQRYNSRIIIVTISFVDRFLSQSLVRFFINVPAHHNHRCYLL